MDAKQTAVINGRDIKNMLLGAYGAFAQSYKQIDDLNVFPVPDGDTGTNMMRTMEAVHRAVTPLDTESAAAVGAAAAKSAIMGARGNSGVILSQLLRGIGRGLAGKERVTGNELGKAFQFGILYAYRSVAKPVEGTILTVARGIAKAAYHAVRRGEDFVEILTEAIDGGKRELARTPELLPALKAAGVVDAGGQGLIVFLQGCLNGLLGKAEPVGEVSTASAKAAELPAEEVDLTNPYCTEFIVKNASVDEKTVCAALLPLGNSLIVAAMDDIVKVHVHTANPGTVLQHGLSWGTLHDIKIDNMAEQHEHRVFSAAAVAQQPKKEGVGLVSVAAGSGIAEIMLAQGVTDIISGGQSMNPPVEDFVTAIENGAYSKYIILPNNKNIVLAAQQAQKLLGADKVAYVPTVNLAQGIAAILAFDTQADMEANVEAMTEAMQQAHCAAVSTAVRDSVVNGMPIIKGEYIGLLENKIVCTGGSLNAAAVDAVHQAGTDWELLTLYYGSEITEDEANSAAAELEKICPGAEVQVLNGAQPLYPLIITLE